MLKVALNTITLTLYLQCLLYITGFLNTQSCTLMNTSLVPMKFTLRVPGDGITDSICGTSDLDSNRSQMGSPPPPLAPRVAHPKEFEILPESGILQPQSEVRVTVNFISNTIKKYEMNMVVDVENVGEEILSLPIFAKYDYLNYFLIFEYKMYSFHTIDNFAIVL